MLTTAAQTQTHYHNDYYSLAAKGPMLDRVYSMRYKSYSAKDYIEKNASHKFMDEYDAKPNCTSFLTYYKNKPFGSVRTCVFNPELQNSVPVMEVFGNEIGNAIGYDSTLIEANRLVIDPSFQDKAGAVARMHVYENIVTSIIAHDAKYLIAGIRTEHIKFYKFMHFDVMSEERAYPLLNFKTVLVICHDVNAFRDRIYSKTRRGGEVVNGTLLSNMSG